MKKTASLLMLTTLAFAPAAFSAPAGTLSVHILDQQTGMPPSDVTVTLEKQQQDKWTPIASGKTDHDGRIKSLYPEDQDMRHCCKVSDEAAFCLIQRPYISKTLLTRRISPRGSP